jgi:hypothetical protein
VSSYAGLPGADKVDRGVRDLNAGRRTVVALLVAAAVTRLRELGLQISADAVLPAEPELELYALLGEEPDPYYRYNALRRELDSFLSTLESRKGRR